MSGEYCPRLIEVALPIREISAESVRDKRIDQGNTSSLHVWWARRPLAASRAVVFASAVPDPDDARCPENFRQTVERLLKTGIPIELRYYRRGREAIRDDDPYRPYSSLGDTLRNRLLTFIARWSCEYLEYEKGRLVESPPSPQVLDDRCLVKWETSDPRNSQGREVLRVARELLHSANGGRAPVILDPFAGGGAIPLEAQRLGCLAVANDYNPVAHLILRATCDYPKRYGKSGKRKVIVEEFGRSAERAVDVQNVLVHDFEYWATRTLDTAREKAGRFYPPGKDGLPVLAYIWARTVPCSNPECKTEIPLIRSLDLRVGSRNIALALEADKARKAIHVKIVRGQAKSGVGTKLQRGPAKCPVCREPTSQEDLRHAAIDGKMRERMMAVVVDNRGNKDYRLVEESDIEAFEATKNSSVDMPSEIIVPEINGPLASPRAGSHRSINLELYGFTRWGQLFNSRQLLALDCLIESLREIRATMDREIHDAEYRAALAVYLALWIDRLAAFGNSFCRWKPSREAILTPFSGQSIPMMWDYPEGNPFSTVPTGGDKQLHRMLDVLLREQANSDVITPQITLGSATDRLVDDGFCDCVITDPPYSDSIAYADLSDFFYVWLKRTVGNLMPEVFRTPQTPKDHEITSHRHRHDGSRSVANAFYRKLLTASFERAKRAVRDPKLVSVMFAHQSTDAWSALLSALFDAGLCPDATWPIATEMPNAALGLGTASLESSVTVVCRPRAAVGAESFKVVKKEIREAVEHAVHRFWDYGFRGADLIVASYGPAVGVFGRYERVERADGTPVEVPELLDFARQAARDAIAGEFRGDNLSTLYYVWSNLYGAAEQSWDDARLVVQIGGDVESPMEVARRHDIFVITGAKCRLALLADRAGRSGLGADPNPPLIDALHRAMLLWKSERRSELVGYLAERGLLDEPRFWKLAQALFEVLPRTSEDWKLVSALLGERDTLRTEAKRTTVVVTKPQVEMDFRTTEAGGE